MRDVFVSTKNDHQNLEQHTNINFCVKWRETCNVSGVYGTGTMKN